MCVCVCPVISSILDASLHLSGKVRRATSRSWSHGRKASTDFSSLYNVSKQVVFLAKAENVGIRGQSVTPTKKGSAITKRKGSAHLSAVALR